MITLQQIQAALDASGEITPRVAELRPSAVLVPLIERDNGLHMLLTQRAEHLRHHAGQISFPGGSMDDTDDDLIHTALRETEEEVGIQQHHINVMGKLPLQPTTTGFLIQPVVGIIPHDMELDLCKDEVSDAFEAPLDFVCDPDNQIHSYREFGGKNYSIYSIPYDGWNIWGATASIIVKFSQLIGHSSYIEKL
ncbi:CoA pyrophosphatase [Kangiella sediminilitoris]|uniref:NUDIX hydrolase n=1 Tax=Kangiella sediminilitoris TaxID=1144748 RepID=A0A1B3B9V0_9GAMM|nr:CoA pyrophosphatase [Kangiella sediminilitoris]AOE49582.1 NUDIX hydrolase [Kangiella sediminilitoris]